MSDLPNSQGAQEQEASYPDTKFTKFFGRLYAAVFALFAITALSVFVLPENILDVSAACADFVGFMKRFFPNIAAIGKISPHTQLAEFYVAVLWVPILTAFALSCVYCPIATFLYKKELPTVKTQLFVILLAIPFAYWALNNYFYADFAVNGIPRRVGSGRIFPTFASRESLFGWISFFTATSMFMSMLVVISLSDIVHWIYLSRNKS
ncbi:hypothetical protein [uncultured Campylobacter sp.]|uniref:hypothetical protein n=1 Tax=uncultured Campylobacter sp. TaxID=218934 RepID=UPI00261933C5|nr:hypothetical protein [uncultured Campylobacter sp.]